MLPELIESNMRAHNPGLGPPAGTQTAWGSQAPGEEVGLGAVTAPLRRKKGVILVCAFAGLLLGGVVSLVMPPVYKARTSLQIESFDDSVLRGISPGAHEAPQATVENYLTNQVKLLESETLARRVADRLSIQGESKIGRVEAMTAELRSWISFLPFGRAVADSAAAGTLPPPPPASQPLAPGSYLIVRAEDWRIKKVQKSLSVRTSLQSQVIEVFYESPNPVIASQGANAAVAEFITMNREARVELLKNTTEWLARQTADLRARVESTNAQLEDFARKTGLVFAGNQGTLAQDRMRQIQEAVARAEADEAAKRARYEAASTSSGLLSDARENSPIRQYETDLQSMRRQLADLRTMYTPDSYKVRRLEAQIAEAEASIRKERKEILSRLHNEYVAASGLQRQLAESQSRQLKVVRQQMDHERRYNMLKSEAESTQRLYDSMLQKMKEAAAASALRMTDVRVIDAARVPVLPDSPNLPMNLAIGLAFGAMAGVGLVVMREASDRVRGPGESMLLPEIHELGVIPSVSAVRQLRRSGVAALKLGENAEPRRYIWDPDSPMMSEPFRSALTSIIFRSAPDQALAPRGQVMTVSSINMMEGKTTVLTNLGMAAAERKHRVLLIDADLRRPRLHDLFDIPNDWGLSNLLEHWRRIEEIDSAPVELLVRRTHIPHLSVLPSGPGSAAVSGLLCSPNLDTLLQRLRRDFDLVLIDSPPLMLYSDPRVLGRVSDGLVMVVRSNMIGREQLRSAYTRLMQDGIVILGTILNDWKMDASQSNRYWQYYGRYQRRGEARGS